MHTSRNFRGYDLLQFFLIEHDGSYFTNLRFPALPLQAFGNGDNGKKYVNPFCCRQAPSNRFGLAG